MKKLVIFFLCFIFFAQNVSADWDFVCKECLKENNQCREQVKRSQKQVERSQEQAEKNQKQAKESQKQAEKSKDNNKACELRAANSQYWLNIAVGVLVAEALALFLQGHQNQNIINFNNQ